MQFGPLIYLITAYDERSAALLNLLTQQRSAPPSSAPPDRLIHLLTLEFAEEDLPLVRAGALLPRLATLVAPSSSDREGGDEGTMPPTGWHWASDALGYAMAWHSQTPHSFWVYDPRRATFPRLFQLPWAFFSPDLSHLPGGIMHGGLAVHDGRGYLFTAPPDGGKTTALSRMPPPWDIQSDDAALVWFDSTGQLLAVPMPTWSAILGHGSALPSAPGNESTTPVPVAGVFVLQQAPDDRLVPLAPIQAAPLLYRAFCEHPTVVPHRRLFGRSLFHCACEIARHTPVGQLQLTEDGPFWEALAGGV